MFPDIPRPFNTQYKCYSVLMLPGNERHDVERGGKSKLHISQLIQILIVCKFECTVISCYFLNFLLRRRLILLPSTKNEHYQAFSFNCNILLTFNT
jgi:hypothetical protein